MYIFLLAIVMLYYFLVSFIYKDFTREIKMHKIKDKIDDDISYEDENEWNDI